MSQESRRGERGGQIVSQESRRWRGTKGGGRGMDDGEGGECFMMHISVFKLELNVHKNIRIN